MSENNNLNQITNLNDEQKYIENLVKLGKQVSIEAAKDKEIFDTPPSIKIDPNMSVDPNEVPFSNVMGKDTNFCIPIMGYYVRFINTHIYVVIPVIIILILEFLFSNKSFDINNNEERRELDYGTRTNTTKEE